MEMDKVIARINELSKKAREQGLTPEETEERAQVRKMYIDAMKASLTGHLERTTILYPDGTKKKVQRKE